MYALVGREQLGIAPALRDGDGRQLGVEQALFPGAGGLLEGVQGELVLLLATGLVLFGDQLGRLPESDGPLQVHRRLTMRRPSVA